MLSHLFRVSKKPSTVKKQAKGMISNKAFPLGVDFLVSGENVCEADKRGAACKEVAKISDF